jgi:hypothetical protein
MVRYSLRISIVVGMPRLSKRLLQVGELSSMANMPRPGATMAWAVVSSVSIFIAASSLSN